MMEATHDHAPPPPMAAARTPSKERRWIPIRSLAEHHRPRILKHLLALDDHDRHLRFGHVASDEQIAHYVAGIDFVHDEVFGVFDRGLDLVATAHLAAVTAGDGKASSSAEFGVSVARHLRGRGIGERLFEHAMLHARNRGVDTMLVHALSENSAMLNIARGAGARVERDGAESRAVVKLAPESLASQVEAIVEAHAASLDYGLKRQARRVDQLFAGLSKAEAAALPLDRADDPQTRGHPPEAPR